MEEIKKNLAALTAAGMMMLSKKLNQRVFANRFAWFYLFRPKIRSVGFLWRVMFEALLRFATPFRRFGFCWYRPQNWHWRISRRFGVLFQKNTDLDVKTVTQKFRIYLKFPILRQLGLSTAGKSDFLFLKIEIFKNFDFCRDFKIEIVPVFKNGRSILIRTFDLPTMMATKIRAIFWENGKRPSKAAKWSPKLKVGTILIWCGIWEKTSNPISIALKMLKAFLI